MNSRIAKKELCCAILFGMASFVACGGDSGSNSSGENHESSNVAEVELANGKAFVCDESMEGVVAITRDDGYRKCEDGIWIKINKNDILMADEIIGQIEYVDDALISSAGVILSSSNVISDNLSSANGSTPESVSSRPMDYSVETFGDIPTCTARRDGSTVLVEENAKKYVCEEGVWIALQSTVKSSSSEKSSSSKSIIPSKNDESSFSEKSSSSKAESSSSKDILSSSSCDISDSELESSDDEDVSSSSKGEPSVIYECIDGSLVANVENCQSQSSSSVVSVSSSVNQNEVLESSDAAEGISYTTICPAGKTCTYAPTTQLNPKVTYGEFLDTRDYQVYKTVTIGTQTWMAQNLNYAYNQSTSTLDSSSFCYDDDPKNCAKYGRLYLWSAAMDSVALFGSSGKGCGNGSECTPKESVQGVCPEGWVLPSVREWNILYEYIEVQNDAGKILKSKFGWDNEGNGTDEYGFSAIPAGYRNNDFHNIGSYADFWSMTQLEENRVYVMDLDFKYDVVFIESPGRDLSVAVRCLRNSDNEGGVSSSSSSEDFGNGAESAASSNSVISYTMECPAGKTCTYAPTTQLNPKVTYGEFLDTRDYQMYKTLTVKGKYYKQTWMAQNLNYNYSQRTSRLESSSFCYANSADSCAKYGRLYLWSAAMDSVSTFSNDGSGCGSGIECRPSGTIRGVCPEGWHLPSKVEWNLLFIAVGGTKTASTVLKSGYGWENDGNGTDAFGFSVLPAGYANDYDRFYSVGRNVAFWGATEYSSERAVNWYFLYDKENPDEAADEKKVGFSVRCILDDDGYVPPSLNSDPEYSAVIKTDGYYKTHCPAGKICSYVATEQLNPFFTYGEFLDTRDYQVYKTATIINESTNYNQTWMAQNLNYAYTGVPFDNGYHTSDSTSWCSGFGCPKHGRFYTWSAAMDSVMMFSTLGKGCGYGRNCFAGGPIQGVCPSGWHLPNNDEWSALWEAVGDHEDALKSIYDRSRGKSDEFGFSALPTGLINIYGNVANWSDHAYFWSSTGADNKYAYVKHICESSVEIVEIVSSKDYGVPVRCVKDASVEPNSGSSPSNEISGEPG